MSRKKERRYKWYKKYYVHILFPKLKNKITKTKAKIMILKEIHFSANNNLRLLNSSIKCNKIIYITKKK